MAHPIAPTAEEIEEARGRYSIVFGATLLPEPIPEKLAHSALKANLRSAGQWLTWLRRSFPETTFIAPYLASIAAGDDDSDPAQREAGLVDCCAVIERCDGIVMAGGRIGTGGARERDHGVMYAERGSYARVRPWPVYDLTVAGWMAPPHHPYQADYDDYPWSLVVPGFLAAIKEIAR
jgi:hypothetical protein